MTSMRLFNYVLLALLAAGLPAAAQAGIVTFDFGSEPEASDFHMQNPASTTVDGVTLSAELHDLGSPQRTFRISSAGNGVQSLGAFGIGSADNFDGEHFNFSFDSRGRLNSIILGFNFESTGSYNLTTPHGGTHLFATDFADEAFYFEAGEQFTLAQASGTYRIKSITITAVPEPGTVMLLGIAGAGLSLFAVRRRRRRALA